MAIQHRRGQYSDFDPTKMVAGEFAVVQSGDPTADSDDSGKAVYIAFEAGSATRLATHNEITNLKNDIEQLDGLSDDVKAALLQIAAKAVYVDAGGPTYYQDLYDALYPPAQTYTVTNTLTGCTTNNAAASVTENAPYSATITASSGYSLTGATVSITMGGTDITATAYNNGAISIASVTGNLSITVTATAVTLSSISAVYTQSGTVYDTDTLDSLKTDLVVTATWSDASTSTVASADYTLSGTLTEGTSTITVTYDGKTTTFGVVVISAGLYPFVSGSKTFADGSVLTISNNNHVKFECKTTITGSGANNPFFNVSNINLIESTELNNPESVNNKPKWFAFENAQSVNFKIDNVVVTGSGAFEIQSNFRKANTNTSYGSALLIAVTSVSGATTTATVTAADISCAFLFFTKCTADAVYEFDMHLTVNGTKYF